MWQQIITNFGFQALWGPSFIVSTILLAILYLWLTGKGRHRFKDSERVPIYKKVLFLAGLFLLYLGWGPFYLIGRLMFSVHMLQMALSLLLTPPLLLLGTPNWLLKEIVSKVSFKKYLTLFTNSVFTVVLFTTLFTFYHIPIIFDFFMVNKLTNDIYQTLLFITATLMWWHVIAPVPEWSQISDSKRVGMIVLAELLLIPVCAVLIFASNPLYGTFTNPEMWAQALSLCLPAGESISPQLIEQFMWIPLIDDQRLGGAIIKIAQLLMTGLFFGYIVLRWQRGKKATAKRRDLQVLS